MSTTLHSLQFCSSCNGRKSVNLLLLFFLLFKFCHQNVIVLVRWQRKSTKTKRTHFETKMEKQQIADFISNWMENQTRKKLCLLYSRQAYLIGKNKTNGQKTGKIYNDKIKAKPKRQPFSTKTKSSLSYCICKRERRWPAHMHMARLLGVCVYVCLWRFRLWCSVDEIALDQWVEPTKIRYTATLRFYSRWAVDVCTTGELGIV